MHGFICLEVTCLLRETLLFKSALCLFPLKSHPLQLTFEGLRFLLMNLVFLLQTFLKTINLLCRICTAHHNSLQRFLCEILHCVKRSCFIANIWLFQQLISSKFHHFQHISACCAAKSQCYKGFMYNVGICISEAHLQHLVLWCWWANQIFHIHEGFFEFIYLK